MADIVGAVGKIETGYTESQSQHAKTGLTHPCLFDIDIDKNLQTSNSIGISIGLNPQGVSVSAKAYQFNTGIPAPLRLTCTFAILSAVLFAMLMYLP